MPTDTSKTAAGSPGLVREFEHWTLLVSALRPQAALVLLERGGSRRVAQLSDESLREMLAIVRASETALAAVCGAEPADCRWVASPDQGIRVRLAAPNEHETGAEQQASGQPARDAVASLASRLRREIPERCEPFKKFGRVYTTGCFDLFHVGHLNILRASKAITDELVVGVSTDDLIESEKGTRPSVSLEDRMAIVAAIRHVDQVIAQTDKDKQRIVDEYAIDAITVGSDWKGGYPAVRCELVYFPYTSHTSSSRLKDEIAGLVRT